MTENLGRAETGHVSPVSDTAPAEQSSKNTRQVLGHDFIHSLTPLVRSLSPTGEIPPVSALLRKTIFAYHRLCSLPPVDEVVIRPGVKVASERPPPDGSEHKVPSLESQEPIMPCRR
jgi:hypothetical protein